MNSKTVKQSKFKNTGVLFELVVRQITADTLAGNPSSPALSIMQEFFNPTTELGKELQLYKAFFERRNLTEVRAVHFMDLIFQQRKKLDEKKLAKEKYDLIREIKQIYDLKEFLSAKIPNYTVYASIYKAFVTETCKDGMDISNIADIATARFSLIEHLSGQGTKKGALKENAVLDEFRNQTEELRLLSYKLVIDKFNEKYAGMNDKQKKLLREYINNVSDTNTLCNYIRNEVPTLKTSLREVSKNVKDKVLHIKLNEVLVQLDTIGMTKKVKDNEITALMIAYQIEGAFAMSKNIRDIIREIIKDELEEVSASGAAGPFNTPNAFMGTSDAGKAKMRKNATQAGYSMVDGLPRSSSDIDPEKAPFKPVKFGEAKAFQRTENTKECMSRAYPKKLFDKTVKEAESKPITKLVKDRSEDDGYELVDKKFTTDEKKADHQDAENGNTPLPFGKGNPNKLPEGVSKYEMYRNDESASPTRKIGTAIAEINKQLASISEVLHMNSRLKQENNLGSTKLWKRTAKHLTKMEAKLLNIAHQIKELKA